MLTAGRRSGSVSSQARPRTGGSTSAQLRFTLSARGRTASTWAPELQRSCSATHYLELLGVFTPTRQRTVARLLDGARASAACIHDDRRRGRRAELQARRHQRHRTARLRRPVDLPHGAAARTPAPDVRLAADERPAGARLFALPAPDPRRGGLRSCAATRIPRWQSSASNCVAAIRRPAAGGRLARLFRSAGRSAGARCVARALRRCAGRFRLLDARRLAARYRRRDRCRCRWRVPQRSCCACRSGRGARRCARCPRRPVRRAGDRPGQGERAAPRVIDR